MPPKHHTTCMRAYMQGALPPEREGQGKKVHAKRISLTLCVYTDELSAGHIEV